MIGMTFEVLCDLIQSLEPRFLDKAKDTGLSDQADKDLWVSEVDVN